MVGRPEGGRSSRAPSGRADPAAEWMRVTVRASAGVSAGRSPARRSASMVLPDPAARS